MWGADQVLGWFRTRMPVQMFVPLAVFLASAAFASDPPDSGARWMTGILLAFGLVALMRLWDDLEDLEIDRIRSPDRVLCEASSLSPFYALGAAILLVIAILLISSTRSLSSLVILASTLIGLWAGYRLRARPGISRSTHTRLLLLKYPLIVVMIGSPNAWSNVGHLVLALLIVYLTLGVYEMLHDPSFTSAERIVLFIHLMLLLTCWCLVLQALWGRPVALRIVQGGGILIGALLAFTALRGYRRNQSQPSIALGVTAISLLSTFALAAANSNWHE